MARSSACLSPRQNPHNGKDELAGGTPIKGRIRCTPALAATYAPTPAVAPVIALFVASAFADSSVIRYSEDDLQQIVRIILETRPLFFPPPVPVSASGIAAAPHYESPHKWSLKAWFPDIY